MADVDTLTDTRGAPQRLQQETFQRAALGVTVVSSVIGGICLIVFLVDLNSQCDVPLNWWLLGCALLSFPATYITGLIKELYGFEATIWSEIVLLVIGFLWMGIGTIGINMSTTCEYTAPVLWWTVFLSVTVFWSVAVGATFFLLAIVLIPMAFTGGKSPGYV
uniref:Membrane protein, putative n=1 Tax=Neospora caninum (strain Liverpool) TaxID=572307 RepID=A0A0F7UAL6_NEOCL|nr:TPA: membrane protein, putative [Neospora caninum Liverpool]